MLSNLPNELKAEIIQYTRGPFYYILNILEQEMGLTSRQEQVRVFHQAFFKSHPMVVTKLLSTELGEEFINCLTLNEVRSYDGIIRVFCSEGRLDLVRLIIDKGLTIEDIKKVDALYWACKSGNAEVVKFLIRKGLTLDDLRKEFEHVTRSICYNGHYEVLRVFLEAGITKEDIQKVNGLYEAFSYNDVRLITMFLDENLDKSYIINQIAKLINGGEDSIVLVNLLNKYICS